MKYPLFPLLFCLALLCGCAAQKPSAELSPAVSAAVETVQASEPAPFISPVAKDTALTQYSLSQTVSGFLPTNRGLVFFSATDKTSLILLDPQTHKPLAKYETDLLLSPEQFTVQCLQTGISYFDSAARETVILDDMLQEIHRIPAPEGLTGAPLISSDGKLLYYCTSDAVRVLELSSGISRVLKEASYPMQGLSGLLLDDSVLQVSMTDTDGSWYTLFLSCETGQLLRQQEGTVSPVTSGNRYFLSAEEGILYGTTDTATMILQPRLSDCSGFFLPDSYHALTAGLSEENTVLELYDLDSGARRSELTLSGIHTLGSVREGPDGTVWFLTLASGSEPQALYCWDYTVSSVSDNGYYLHPYHTWQDPDYDGLAACTLQAQELGKKYGLNILIYRDAVAVKPWDYQLKPEHQVSILQRELTALDRHLAAFPEGFLSILSETYTSLNLCLVANAVPISQGSESVSGIQFLDGYDAYIVLVCGEDTEKALYHELSHLMETVVLSRSTAWDRWKNLNPEGFAYGRSPDREWLQPGREWFIDGYAMTSPAEDRARLFEYAVTPGNADLFRSPPLQEKLRQLCIGIREGFGLEKYNGALPWEQYLTS